MIIGLDVAKVPPPRDGIGVYCHGLLEAVVAALGPDDALVLYGLPDPGDRRRLRLELPAARDLEIRGVPAPSGQEVDLFHSTSWHAVRREGPRAFAGPVLFTVYDLTAFSHSEHHTVANRLHVGVGLLAAVLDRRCHFLAISRATARALEEELEVASGRIDVVHPGPNGRFRPGSPDGLVALGLEPGYVLAVGTREPRKNLRALVAAWRRLPEPLRRRHPLVVAGGRGWKHDDDDVHLADPAAAVRTLGRVSDDELATLYRGAALFVYPSLAEGFGLPVAEALASGAPVLTSSTGATAEVAGDAARLADPTDPDALATSLRELLEHPEVRERLAAAGPDRAARFSWVQAGRRVVEIYRRLASG